MKHRMHTLTPTLFSMLALPALVFFNPGDAGAGTSLASHAKFLDDPVVPVDQPYEAGRGLITLQGPSGMFINPTSATLPEDAFTIQACLILPNNSTDVVGTGVMATYGVTDFLELGGYGNYAFISGASDLAAAGPIARLRLLKDEGPIPQFSIGGYARFGDKPFERYSWFAAAYKRLPIDEDGFLKSAGFHAGVRQTFRGAGGAEDPLGYGGVELQFPLRVYLVGEVSTKDRDEGDKVPYAAGVQWRLGGINVSIAALQTGAFSEPSFWFGIGTAMQF